MSRKVASADADSRGQNLPQSPSLMFSGLTPRKSCALSLMFSTQSSKSSCRT